MTARRSSILTKRRRLCRPHTATRRSDCRMSQAHEPLDQVWLPSPGPPRELKLLKRVRLQRRAERDAKKALGSPFCQFELMVLQSRTHSYPPTVHDGSRRIRGFLRMVDHRVQFNQTDAFRPCL